MARQLFQAKLGFSDNNVSYLSGAGVPGGDASYQDTAGVGSYYTNVTTGDKYTKHSAGAGTANWVRLTTTIDASAASNSDSWREPVTVRDAVNTTTAAAVIEMNAADTLDGIAIALNNRVLLSEVAGGAGPNVYIVGGSTGAWTLTEDTNAETAGDTLQVLSGTSADQIWFFDGTVWGYIGSSSSADDANIRAFIGKGAAGGELPAYTSNNYVANNDSLETAIGKLDAQSSLNATAASNASTAASNVQAELDATQTGAGLGTGGAYTVVGGSNYYTTATSITGALAELDTNVATNFTTTNGNVTTNASNITNLQTEINAVETGAGLATDGTFISYSGTTYLDATTTLANAIDALDNAAGANATNIATNTGDITTINGTLTNHQTEIDAIETGTGLSATGAYITVTGSNYTNASTSVTNAISLLDTQLGTTDAKVGNNAYSSNTYVTDTSSATVAIGALDAAITDLASTSTTAGTTSGIVGTALVDDAVVVKWIVRVLDTVTGDVYSAEVLASHDGTSTADAVSADYTEYAELELGNEVAGINFNVTLTGTGTGQAMNLVHNSTNACDVSVRRFYA